MKKLLMLLLAGTMALSIAGCGSKGEKYTLYEDTWEGKDLKISADFYYPKDVGITIEKNGYLAGIILKYEAMNVEMNIDLYEDVTYDDNKEIHKERYKDSYTEFEMKDFDCYSYEDTSWDEYVTFIHIEEVSETTDRYVKIVTEYMNSAGAPKDQSPVDIPEVKKIIESITYNGVVDAPPSIIDEWITEQEPKESYDFWSKGDGRIYKEDGMIDMTYTDNGDSVSITCEGDSAPTEYKYRIENNKLILTDPDGKEITFVRK